MCDEQNGNIVIQKSQIKSKVQERTKVGSMGGDMRAMVKSKSLQNETKKDKMRFINIHVKESAQGRMSMRRKVKTTPWGSQRRERRWARAEKIDKGLLNPRRPPTATVHRPHPHQCRCQCPPTYQSQHLPHHPVQPSASASASTPRHHHRSQKTPQQAHSGFAHRVTTAQRQTRPHFLSRPSTPCRRHGGYGCDCGDDGVDDGAVVRGAPHVHAHCAPSASRTAV
jgi:hypothetical protein